MRCWRLFGDDCVGAEGRVGTAAGGDTAAGDRREWRVLSLRGIPARRCKSRPPTTLWRSRKDFPENVTINSYENTLFRTSSGTAPRHPCVSRILAGCRPRIARDAPDAIAVGRANATGPPSRPKPLEPDDDGQLAVSTYLRADQGGAVPVSRTDPSRYNGFNPPERQSAGRCVRRQSRHALVRQWP